jgi:hypothetical protein
MNPYDLRRKAKTDAQEKIKRISALDFKKKVVKQLSAEDELIKNELEALKLTQTPQNLFIKKQKCKDVKFFEYMNESLGIIVLGMQQPQQEIESCVRMIVQYNVKVYVTFNEEVYHSFFEQEQAEFLRDCKQKDCEFYSVSVQDYTPPRVDQLHTLWLIMDRFHLNRAEGNPVNLLMHCTGGTGRTATMIISYIWYKVYLQMSEPTLKLEADLTMMKNANAPLDSILSFLFNNEIIRFLMDEIAKYTPEARMEVFYECMPYDMLVLYANEHELHEMQEHYQGYSKDEIEMVRESKRDLFLQRIYNIIAALTSPSFSPFAITNPILMRLPGGIIKTSKKSTQKDLKKKVQGRLSPKMDVIFSEHAPLHRREPTWSEWFGNLFG